MPSRLSRRPAASMIRRRVACLCSLPYRAMRCLHSPEDIACLRPTTLLLYYDHNSIARRPPQMAMTTASPVALVTGASSGIGKAAALALVAGGFRGGRNEPQRLASHPARDGVTFLDLDVTSDESVTAVVQQVIERFGRIDVLVNNAGIGSIGRRRGKLRRPGPARLRHQRLRRHPHDEGRPAAHARPGTRTHHQHLVRARVRPRALHGRLRRVQARDRGLLRVPGPRGPRARRPGAPRRARRTPRPASTPTPCSPTRRCRSTRSSGRHSTA